MYKAFELINMVRPKFYINKEDAKHIEMFVTHRINQLARDYDVVGSFVFRGKGDYPKRYRSAKSAVKRYLIAHDIDLEQGYLFYFFPISRGGSFITIFLRRESDCV